jgi:CheY-like chemotaxis protein
MRACVLIVDDHAIIRKRLRSLFEAQDMEVQDAEDGADGLRKAQEVHPVLIILDLSMPVMNGFEAARALKLILPHIPLLMFTNNIGVVMEQEARSAGIYAVVCKSEPDSSEQLLVLARALLNRPAAA